MPDMPNEILNLDSILPEEAYVTFQKTKHAILPLSTRDYLELTRQQADQAKLTTRNPEPDEVINTKYALQLINRAIPTISIEELEALPVGAIQALAGAVQEATEMRNPKDEDEEPDQGN